jgi:hypothetical protein
MDLLERFPGAWCDTCRKVQPVILDVMEADERNDHEAADIICDACKSILVTLHAPSTSRPVVRTKKAAKASEMAAQEIDRLIDPSAPDEERQRRKRRLINLILFSLRSGRRFDAREGTSERLAHRTL